MVQTILRQMLEAGGMDDLAVCLYSLSTTGDYDDRPLFFYHMAKAGGIGVHTALLAANNLAEQVAGDRKAYFRFHADDDNANQSMTMIRQNTVRAVAYVGKVGLRTYGVHAALAHPWRLMTLLRDPFDRLVSRYYYHIRRGNRPGPAHADDFMAYVNLPTSRDYQCKMLSKLGAGECEPGDALDEAKANLEDFDWVGTLADFEEIMLGVWSTYGFYPYLSQRIHRNPHKADTFENLRDDIYELNRFDKELFAHVEANKKNLFDVAGGRENRVSLPEVTALLTDSDQDDRGQWQTKFIQTQGLLQFAHEKGGTLKKLYALMPDN